MGREISCLGGFQECIASLAFGGFNGSSEDLSLEVGVIKIKSSTVLETSCVPNHVGPTVKTAEAYLPHCFGFFCNVHEGGDGSD